ncbi:MAG: NOP5/NOP56 family protein, partial [archaeon]
REKAMKKTKEKIKKEKGERDQLAIQIINSIDNLDKTSNTILEQFKEIYSLYFPELDKEIDDPDKFLEIATKIKEKENFKSEELEKIIGDKEKSEKIKMKAKSSTGADLDGNDLEKITGLGEIALKMRLERKKLEEHLEKIMNEIAPNLTAILGSTIGARILSEAGSLKKLAMMPSSTVQVLGAEKALFAHLRKNVNPPKHGIIFQYPNIKGSPLNKRGKISRKVAAKASIASRIDYFDGEYKGEELKKELEEDIEEILN